MRVCVEYYHHSDKQVDKTDKVIDAVAYQHYGKFTGSGYGFPDGIRDREYKVPHKYLAGFLTEVTDYWKKFKLHRVVVHAK